MRPTEVNILGLFLFVLNSSYAVGRSYPYYRQSASREFLYNTNTKPSLKFYNSKPYKNKPTYARYYYHKSTLPVQPHLSRSVVMCSLKSGATERRFQCWKENNSQKYRYGMIRCFCLATPLDIPTKPTEGPVYPCYLIQNTAANSYSNMEVLGNTSYFHCQANGVHGDIVCTPEEEDSALCKTPCATDTRIGADDTSVDAESESGSAGGSSGGVGVGSGGMSGAGIGVGQGSGSGGGGGSGVSLGGGSGESLGGGSGSGSGSGSGGGVGIGSEDSMSDESRGENLSVEIGGMDGTGYVTSQLGGAVDSVYGTSGFGGGFVTSGTIDGREGVEKPVREFGGVGVGSTNVVLNGDGVGGIVGMGNGGYIFTGVGDGESEMGCHDCDSGIEKRSADTSRIRFRRQADLCGSGGPCPSAYQYYRFPQSRQGKQRQRWYLGNPREGYSTAEYYP